MKYLISITIAIAAFFVVALFLEGMGTRNGIGPLALIAGIIAFITSLYKINESNDAKHTDLYAKAEEEYDSGKINKGLWSQALVKAKGDEKLRKIEYMKLRVKHLKRSH